jgi:uncharacterized protein YbjT (DUF2867 family)
MKIVVVGGTGRIGATLVGLLAAGGHEAVAASRSSGVDTVTGEGLAGVLAGAAAVVDVTNAPTLAPDAVLDFFRRSSEQLLPAERAAGVGHHVVLSIVGVDGLAGGGYLRAKKAQEELVEAAGVPYTIARATQFFEFLGTIADAMTVDGVVRAVPALIQPIAAGDVAALLAEIAVAPPVQGIVDLAGPEAAPISDTLRRCLAAAGDGRAVVDDPSAAYFGATLAEKSLVPTMGRERLGTLTLARWLAR